MSDKILVADFGGQYNHLIARRVRELGVYTEIVDFEDAYEIVRIDKPLGVIFTGGGDSVLDSKSPTIEPEFFDTGVPVLGICYGMQLMAHILGGQIFKSEKKEYGKIDILNPDTKSKLFEGIENITYAWMSHSDYVETLPEDFIKTSNTQNIPYSSFENPEKKLYGTQFHPEVTDTPFGMEMLNNFVFKICKATRNWKIENFVDKKIEEIKGIVGDKKVLCALSGGVDSSVAATLTHKAIGPNLTCIFVDHGLLRKNEATEVMSAYAEKLNINVIKVDASEKFLLKLEGVTDPEKKRKIIGTEFINTFDDEAKKLGVQFDFLLQGTIYPDIVESGRGGKSKNIKSHHNVGGLPEKMKLKLLEPLKLLYKDEVRRAGEELGLSKDLVWRQPFPGPGLAIRCLGEITAEKLNLIKESDYILREEIDAYNAKIIEKTNNHADPTLIWQYFTVLPNIKSVGVMGDDRTYDNAIGIRAVHSVDGMTSDWGRLPLELLEKISNRIVNEVDGINRVLYDITTKPPGTIEWE